MVALPPRRCEEGLAHELTARLDAHDLATLLQVGQEETPEQYVSRAPSSTGTQPSRFSWEPCSYRLHSAGGRTWKEASRHYRTPQVGRLRVHMAHEPGVSENGFFCWHKHRVLPKLHVTLEDMHDASALEGAAVLLSAVVVDPLTLSARSVGLDGVCLRPLVNHACSYASLRFTTTSYELPGKPPMHLMATLLLRARDGEQAERGGVEPLDSGGAADGSEEEEHARSRLRVACAVISPGLLVDASEAAALALGRRRHLASLRLIFGAWSLATRRAATAAAATARRQSAAALEAAHGRSCELMDQVEKLQRAAEEAHAAAGAAEATRAASADGDAAAERALRDHVDRLERKLEAAEAAAEERVRSAVARADAADAAAAAARAQLGASDAAARSACVTHASVLLALREAEEELAEANACAAASSDAATAAHARVCSERRRRVVALARAASESRDGEARMLLVLQSQRDSLSEAAAELAAVRRTAAIDSARPELEGAWLAPVPRPQPALNRRAAPSEGGATAAEARTEAGTLAATAVAVPVPSPPPWLIQVARCFCLPLEAPTLPAVGRPPPPLLALQDHA